MIIGIEGQRLFRVKKHGMDIVALELIRRLPQLDTQNRYVIFVKDDEDRGCLQESENVKICVLPSAPYPVWEQIILPRAARNEKCDLLHCTSNTAPLFTHIPIVTTVHDIIYLEKISLLSKEGSHYQRLGNMYRRLIVPFIAKRSKRIVTVSEFEKTNIQNVLGLNSTLRVIHNGVSPHFTKIEDKKTLENTRKKYKLPENFIFFLGNTDPKKNTINVLKAFALYKQQHDDDLWLVMPDFEESVLLDMLNKTVKPDIRKQIITTGYVPNTELPAIINQCKMLLYPSLRESFGIPILEGMACGVPVVTSNTSSMPEIAGDAALLVDPVSPSELYAAIERVLNEPGLAATLSSKGLLRSGDFSWDKMAESYIRLYQEVFDEM